MSAPSKRDMREAGAAIGLALGVIQANVKGAPEPQRFMITHHVEVVRQATSVILAQLPEHLKPSPDEITEEMENQVKVAEGSKPPDSDSSIAAKIDPNVFIQQLLQNLLGPMLSEKGGEEDGHVGFKAPTPSTN